MDEIWTVPEAARYLKISRAKLYYLVKRREIPHIKIGRNKRIMLSELEKWIDKHKVKELV